MNGTGEIQQGGGVAVTVQTQIDRLVGAHMIGSDGEDIGKISQVYLEDSTGRPEWVTVKPGMFGRQTFVPLAQARWVGEELHVPYDKHKIKEAPHIDTGRRLTAEHETQLYRHYGVHPGGVPAPRRTPPGDMTEETAARMAGDATAEDTTARTTGERAEDLSTGDIYAGDVRAEGVDAEDMRVEAPHAGEPSAAGRHAGEPLAESGQAVEAPAEGKHAESGYAEMDLGAEHPGEISMIRSVEELHVGIERRQAGVIHVRKHVVTEDVERMVPVMREVVEIEREPITDAMAEEELQVGEDEQEVILHEEHVITSKETKPVERIRIHTREVAGEETVHGRVRREEIEIDRDDATTRRSRIPGADWNRDSGGPA